MLSIRSLLRPSNIHNVFPSIVSSSASSSSSILFSKSIFNSFAVKQSYTTSAIVSSSGNVSSAPAIKGEQSIAASLKDLRSSFISELDKDIIDLDEQSGADNDLQSYINELKWTVNIDREHDVVTAARNVDGIGVTIRFVVNDHTEETEEDYDDNEEHEQQQQEDGQEREHEEQNEDEEQQAQGRAPVHRFEVEITNPKQKSQYLRIDCVANQNEDLDVQTIIFTDKSFADEKSAPALGEDNSSARNDNEELINNTLDVETLSNDAQDALFDYLQALAIDHDAAKFVQLQARAIQNQQQKARIAKLRAFIAN